MQATNAVRMQQFDEDGYFVVKDLLEPEVDLRPVEEGDATLLGDLAAKWYYEGKLASTYKDYLFSKRLSKVLCEVGLEHHQYFATTLPQSVSEDHSIHLGPAIFNLLRSPRILDIIESLIGPEIYSHSLQTIRLKVPEHMVMDGDTYWDGQTQTVDWHQELGIILPEADDTNVVSVWLPTTDATVENGGLMIVLGSHRGGLSQHCLPNQSKGKVMTHIPEELVALDRAIPMPMKRGSALFFHQRLIHCSHPNQSDDLRWSFDFRCLKTGQPAGRAWLPGFVIRSRVHPEREMQNSRDWAGLWLKTRARLAGKGKMLLHRRDDTSPVCL